MDAEPKTQKIPLSIEDRARMARLFDFLEGSLHEMGRIVTRTTSLDTARGYEIKFNPRQRQSGDVDIEIICDENGCICYDYREGICIPC